MTEPDATIHPETYGVTGVFDRDGNLGMAVVFDDGKTGRTTGYILGPETATALLREMMAWVERYEDRDVT